MLTDALTLSLLGRALQRCQGFGSKGQGSQCHDQSGTSEKYEQTERKDQTPNQPREIITL